MLHFWQNLSPAPGAFLGDLGQSPSRGDRSIILLPLLIPERIDLRRATIRVRDSLAAGAPACFALALYKVSSPALSKRRTLNTSSSPGGAPGGTGLFELTLIVDMGKHTNSEGHDGELAHFTSATEYPLLPEQYPFAALSVITAADAEIFSPHTTEILPSVGFVAADLGPGLITGGAVGWPKRLGIDRGSRAFTPHITLRSALGVQLYGDPQFG